MRQTGLVRAISMTVLWYHDGIFAAMPTPAERKALLFLAGIIVLGASVRVVRAARDDGSADAGARQALSRQLAAVDSARRRDATKKGITKGSRGGRRAGGHLFTRADSATPGDSARSTRSTPRAGRRPPIRVSSSSPVLAARDTAASAVAVVDLDVASESDIERLPRIGPVLAHRIIEDRSAHGAFGSIEGFERVRGVGPSLAQLLRPRVTFSGTARPSNAIVDSGLRPGSSQSKSRRRERRR